MPVPVPVPALLLSTASVFKDLRCDATNAVKVRASDGGFNRSRLPSGVGVTADSLKEQATSLVLPIRSPSAAKLACDALYSRGSISACLVPWNCASRALNL
jgi:hypothetical protein